MFCFDGGKQSIDDKRCDRTPLDGDGMMTAACRQDDSGSADRRPKATNDDT